MNSTAAQVAPARTETATAAGTDTMIWFSTLAGWGAHVKVTVAGTPEADAAAAAFFRRVCVWPGPSYGDYNVAAVDEEATGDIGPELYGYFYPECEHGLSAHLCAGPGHYPMGDQF